MKGQQSDTEATAAPGRRMSPLSASTVPAQSTVLPLTGPGCGKMKLPGQASAAAVEPPLRPVLVDRLRHAREAGVRRFLAAALDQDPPTLDGLLAAGVPHFDAKPYLERLLAAAEISHDGWRPEFHAAYRDLLAGPQPAATATRKLARRAEGEQPREKAQTQGIASLADAELIALLLRTGGSEGVIELAERLLSDYDGLLGLAACDVQELARERGLGAAKACELAAAFEIGRRLARARRRSRSPLRDPESVAALVAAELAPLRHEELWCLPLDARSCLIGEPRIVSRGDIDGTDAGPRAFYRCALLAHASSAIAVHNHPTGSAEPSPADLAVTRRLVAAGRSVDVALQDHLIIGDGGRHHSLRRSNPELFA